MGLADCTLTDYQMAFSILPFMLDSGNASMEAARHQEMRQNNSSTVHSQDVGPGNTDGYSFIGLSLSCDGRDWAPLIEVASTTGRSGRTEDQVRA